MINYALYNRGREGTMIKFILLAIVFVLNISANAAVQTDTHTYIVSRYLDSVIAVDRNNGHETRIRVVAFPREFLINGDYGYAFGGIDEKISVIDLKNNKVMDTISLEEVPHKFYIHDGFGYVLYLSVK